MDLFRKQIQGMFGEGYTPPSTHRSIAPSSAVSFQGETEHWEEQEEVDLIALQTTPEEYKEAGIDVGKFELQTVSANCTPEAIDELTELRLRQLHVQVQQLVHHVTANTDNLTAGIQTCRSTGTLLQNAIVSIQQARTRLGLAGTDASTSLKIAQLYRRNQQLANIMEICSHALMLQQKSADAEEAAFSAKAAVDANEPGSVMGICQAMLLLSNLSSQLSESHLKPLSIVEPISQRVHAQQTAVRQLVFKQLQNVCSHEFTASEFDRLATLHVLDVHSGAELPERIRDTFLTLVTASDQYQPGERPPSLLQALLAKDRNATQTSRSSGGGSSSGATAALANDSLTALYRAVPAVKFRGMLERVMQTQFVWLQTFHAMQLHVQSELQEARTVLSALDRGAALEVDWSSGLPQVRVASGSAGGDSAHTANADPSGAGDVETPPDASTGVASENQEGNITSQQFENSAVPSVNGSAAAQGTEASGAGGVEASSKDGAAVSEGGHARSAQNGATNGVLLEQAVSLHLSVGSGSQAEKPVLVQLVPRNTAQGVHELQSKTPCAQRSPPGSLRGSRSTTTPGAAAEKHTDDDANGTHVVQHEDRQGEQQSAVDCTQSTAAAGASGAGHEVTSVPSEVGGVPSGDGGVSGDGVRSRGQGERGDGEGPWGSSVASEPESQIMGSLAGHPLSLEEFVKQRERIFHGVAAALRKCRVEFGRQAARNIVKLYEACATVQSEAFHSILRHGLDFASMVTAFCAEKPDELENDMEALPHDYLLDVVKAACGQRLFHAFSREQRDILMEALLPIEQCQCINARAMKKVADAASAPVYGSDRAGMSFSWWATAHSFQHRGGGMGRTRRLQAEPAAIAPSPESLRLISGAVDSVDAPTAGTKSASSVAASHVTPHSIAGSGLAASQHAALDGNETQDSTAADDTDAAQRVFLQATRHIARAWAIYGSLLPVFRSTADVPRHIVQAIQSLFEEYMLWTVVTFADVSATTVVRGLSGKHARFFRVIRSLMLRSDRASRTRQYEQQLLAATAAADSERKGGPVSTTPEAVEMQEGVGVGGGTLDRLVRGTIACDSLATLARDLLELEPVLREQYASSGDEDMLRVIAELFENTSGQLVRVPVAFASATGTERVHGSVHEVETVRRRCVEGSVVYNLGSLESNLFGKLRTKSYAATGLTDASNVPWLKSLRQDLNLFVDALVFCTESRSLTQDSLQEIWMMAVMHIDKVVLQGLSECVEVSSSKFKGFMSSMANAAKSADKRQAKRGLSTDGCMQLGAEVTHLVRLIALAQPKITGAADVYTLMTVNKWAEGCHNEMVAQCPTMIAQQRMIEQWMSWAATCHRGTQEGKTQCLALFTAVQRLKGIPDSCPWVRDLKAEVLA